MFDNIDIPILYKYRRTTPPDEVCRLIEAGELWFSRATSFNDPFDTSITYNFDGLESDIAEKWANQAAERYAQALSEAKRREFASQRLNKIRKDPGYLQTMRNEFIEHNYDSFSICSLSALNDSLLMWGHYAHNHQGLCIGLDVSQLWKVAQQLASRDQVLDLVKVSYSDSKPQINFFEAMLADDSDEVRAFYSSKSAPWAYENEYRLVTYNRTNFAHQFGPQLVKQVIFGCKTLEPQRDAVVNFCREHNPSVSLFQATMDERQYKLNITLID